MVSAGRRRDRRRLGRRLRLVDVVRVEQMRRHRRAVVGEILAAQPGRVVLGHLLDVGLEAFGQVHLSERHLRLLREPLLVGHVVAGDDQLLDAFQRRLGRDLAQDRVLDHPQQRAAQRFVGRIGLDHRHVGEPRVGVGLGRWRRVAGRRAGWQGAAERRIIRSCFLSISGSRVHTAPAAAIPSAWPSGARERRGRRGARPCRHCPGSGSPWSAPPRGRAPAGRSRGCGPCCAAGCRSAPRPRSGRRGSPSTSRRRWRRPASSRWRRPGRSPPPGRARAGSTLAGPPRAAGRSRGRAGRASARSWPSAPCPRASSGRASCGGDGGVGHGGGSGAVEGWPG